MTASGSSGARRPRDGQEVETDTPLTEHDERSLAEIRRQLDREFASTAIEEEAAERDHVRLDRAGSRGRRRIALGALLIACLMAAVGAILATGIYPRADRAHAPSPPSQPVAAAPVSSAERPSHPSTPPAGPKQEAAPHRQPVPRPAPRPPAARPPAPPAGAVRSAASGRAPAASTATQRPATPPTAPRSAAGARTVPATAGATARIARPAAPRALPPRATQPGAAYPPLSSEISARQRPQSP